MGTHVGATPAPATCSPGRGHGAEQTGPVRPGTPQPGPANPAAAPPPPPPGPAGPLPRRAPPPPGTRGRAARPPTCARRAVRAVRTLGRAQRAPEAGRQVARGPARQGEDGRGPALRRRPPPRRARQVPRAWQLAPVHHLELFSGVRLRPRPRRPLRRAAVAPAGGHLGHVTWPPHVAARAAPPAGRRAGVGALLPRFPGGAAFSAPRSPSAGLGGGREGGHRP